MASTLAGAILVATSIVFLVTIARLPSEGPGLAALFKAPTDLGWPRGVQEEEPVRWRVELLAARRDRRPSPTGLAERDARLRAAATRDARTDLAISPTASPAK